MERLSENLKGLRVAKKLTQEQAAEALNVSAQTISRWECGITLPDVTKLPELAHFYGVTIDDLFAETAVGYENYAQRLAAIYEADRTTENFVRVEQEFRRMLSHEGGSLDDMRTFGIMYQFMMCSCRDNALYWFDRAIQESRGVDPEMYRRTRQQKLRLQMLLGKAEEMVEQQQKELEEFPEQADSWVLLVVADMYAQHYEEAYDLVQQAMERFPEEWELTIHACNIARHLEKYPEAIRYADRAIAMRPAYVDGMYEKSWCYEKMGKHREAGRLCLEIAEALKRDGFEVEAETEFRNARKLLEQAET